MAKSQKSFAHVARAARQAEHDNMVASLKNELDAERKAHRETLGALEALRARGTARRKIKPAPKRRRSAKDIVEVIFSDVHGNKVDHAAWAAFINDLQQINPDRIFIGGDFLDCGGFLAEHHTLGYVAETQDSYQDDVDMGNSMLDQIQEICPNAAIHYLEGNHEWRVERWALTQKLAHHSDVDLLRRTFCAEHVLNLASRGITYYRQGECHGELTVPGWVKMDKLLYVHKVNNSRNAASRAVDQAGGNIVFFDTHRADFNPTVKPAVGLITAWNPGCLCTRQPLWNNTRPTGWNHGYLVRFISGSTKAFQMVNITINEGQSYAGLLLGTRTAEK